VIAILAGCRGSSSDSGPAINVIALAGEIQVEPGAVVVATGVDGSPIDRQLTDGTGYVTLNYAPGALVTIFYVRQNGTQLVTTPALANDILYVRGPLPDAAPIIAGVVEVDAPAITADDIEIDLGCTTVAATTFPKDVDILATCFGTDSNIDVLIRATTAGVITSYSAQRVPIVAEVGMMEISAWDTQPTLIPIASDAGAAIAIDEVADGFVFAAPTTAPGAIWNGLSSDETRIHATLGTSFSTQYTPGLPTAISFAATDFLPPTTTALAQSQTAFSWPVFGVGDLTHLHAAWTAGSTHVTWDVVLDPSATAVTFPVLDSDLVDQVGSPVNAATSLHAVDGPDTTSFADVQAAGLWMTDGSIVTPVTSGEIRESVALSSN
jgi:hypothetical protein